MTQCTMPMDASTTITIPFSPSNFAGGPITNQFMPLAAGNTWFYRSTDGSTDTVTVTNKTISIDGVKCVVVSDIVKEGNKTTEITSDYFAQDKAGNVWYFGEDTKAFLPGGGVSTQGTWRAGVNNAQPGIIMLAHPQKGDLYFEENAPGVAVDQAQVVAVNASVSVPFGTFKHCLETRNFSTLFPGDVEHKFYAPGIGSVLEVDPDGNRQELVSFNGHTSLADTHNLVQAMANFGDHQFGLAQSLPMDQSANASLQHVLAPHSQHA
jgi:hypothetical protein